MDESEFVVVEEGHNEEVKVAISDLKEAEQAYRAAHDALVKSNILLQDTLSLTLELALKKITPDFASDTDEITKKINESLYSSTEAVLRDHVKSLCSKLVAVNDEYEKLAKKFKAFKPPESFEPMPHLERLATILDQIDELLPNEGTPAEAPSTDIEKLCARAESIRDRVGLALEASGDKQLDTKPEVIRNVFEEPRAPLSESESQMSHHQSPSRLNSTYQPDPHIGSTRRSLFVDDDVQLPLGHVQRLKKKLIVSLEERSNHVPSDLRVLPKRIPGAKDLFGGTRDTASQITSPAPLPLKRPPTKSEAISLRKSIASLAAAAALQRNESVRAKEVIVDGCGGERIHVVASPTHKLVSAQTQTELAGACPWWGVMLDGPVWRPRSMSFSAASSGIGMDDGSNFQEEFSSVSKNCWVCCKHSAAFAGGGGAGCGINQLQPGGIGSTTPDLLNEISRMIREEVTSVLQVEMANILDQQRDLIQQAIKPLAEENQADRKPSGSQGQPLQNSASAAAYPEFSSSSDTPLRESQLQQPTALPLEHSFHNSPSFLPEEVSF
ncbi:unnamed protein product [Mesocestoides corti]|uniref:Uncharacterized protein n=1 Tax=Mesocestoides corti TaxID=53468 RepID=A0A158QTK2_MESCO|nr:unnamed protein product [Mesocestoides corti]